MFIYIFFFKGGPATDSFYVLAPLITLLHNFFRTIIIIIFQYTRWRHLKSSSCPSSPENHSCRYCFIFQMSHYCFIFSNVLLLFHFSSIPLLFHFFNCLLLFFIFVIIVVIVSFFQSSRFCFIFFNHLVFVSFYQSSKLKKFSGDGGNWIELLIPSLLCWPLHHWESPHLHFVWLITVDFYGWPNPQYNSWSKKNQTKSKSLSSKNYQIIWKLIFTKKYQFQ